MNVLNLLQLDEIVNYWVSEFNFEWNFVHM